MNLPEIFSLLKNQFGEALVEPAEAAPETAFFKIKAESLPAIARFLKDAPDLSFDFLRLLTAVDAGTALVSVYHLYSYKHQHALVLKVDAERANPSVPSVSAVWPAADWYEREAFDMVGIVYEGHPYLRRILLPADWDGFPLRKDYTAPGTYHGISNE